MLGVSRPALSAFLNGRSDLSGNMALRIEKAFGVEMDTLMRMQASFDIARTRKRAGRRPRRTLSSKRGEDVTSACPGPPIVAFDSAERPTDPSRSPRRPYGADSYSARRTSVGSTRVAYRAGPRQARNAAARKRAGTAASVVGSAVSTS